MPFFLFVCIQSLFDYLFDYHSPYYLVVVYFLKRAQIFVADVWHRFEGRGYGEFHDIDSLTMFADYRFVWGTSADALVQLVAPLDLIL